MSDIKKCEYPTQTEYWKGNNLHRVDGPAVEYQNGGYEYWFNGKLHRDEKDTEGNLFPAVGGWPNGTNYWYLNGVLHREDGPAVEYPDGTKEWWVNGEFIREE